MGGILENVAETVAIIGQGIDEAIDAFADAAVTVAIQAGTTVVHLAENFGGFVLAVAGGDIVAAGHAIGELAQDIVVDTAAFVGTVISATFNAVADAAEAIGNAINDLLGGGAAGEAIVQAIVSPLHEFADHVALLFNTIVPDLFGAIY